MCKQIASGGHATKPSVCSHYISGTPTIVEKSADTRMAALAVSSSVPAAEINMCLLIRASCVKSEYCCLGADARMSDICTAVEWQVEMDVTHGQRTALIQLFLQTTAELSTLEAEQKQLAQRLKVSSISKRLHSTLS